MTPQICPHCYQHFGMHAATCPRPGGPNCERIKAARRKPPPCGQCGKAYGHHAGCPVIAPPVKAGPAAWIDPETKWLRIDWRRSIPDIREAVQAILGRRKVEAA